MNKLAILLIPVLLAGCGTTAPNKTFDDLREPIYLRSVQNLPLSFAQIQMALFKHQAACGSGPVFAANPQNASYAMVTQELTPGGGPEHTILVDLVLLQNRPVRASAYSYYAGLDEQIRNVFDAIRHPGVCR
jgi:hypothetical protein